MRRGTTPTITFTVDNVDLTTLTALYVTFKQSGVWSVTKKNGDDGVTVEAHKITVKLTQQETLKFRAGGTVMVGFRGRTVGGDAIASEPKALDGKVGDVLYDGVI